MQFSKFLKVAAVALPLMAVTACASNSISKVGGNGVLSKEALEHLQKQIGRASCRERVYSGV